MAMADPLGCLTCHPDHYRDKGTCIDCHGGRPDTRRPDIAHYRMIAARFAAFTLEDSPVVEKGLDLLRDHACRRCHISGDKGNDLAANLDWSPRNSTPEELYTAVEEPALLMPNFHFDKQQLVALVNAIHAESRRVPHQAGEVPLVIHFTNSGKRESSVFQRDCGACHGFLSRQQGSLGTGVIGPNLSGLLSEYYPKTYPEAKSWSVKGLEEWLGNPRKLLKNARMRPVKLKAADWQNLQRELLDMAL